MKIAIKVVKQLKIQSVSINIFPWNFKAQESEGPRGILKLNPFD